MLQSTGAKATKSLVFSHKTALYWPAIVLLLVGLTPSSSTQPALLGFAFALPLLADPGGWASLLAPHEPEGCGVYGTGVILAGASVLLCAFAIGAWRAR